MLSGCATGNPQIDTPGNFFAGGILRFLVADEYGKAMNSGGNAQNSQPQGRPERVVSKIGRTDYSVAFKELTPGKTGGFNQRDLIGRSDTFYLSDVGQIGFATEVMGCKGCDIRLRLYSQDLSAPFFESNPTTIIDHDRLYWNFVSTQEFSSRGIRGRVLANFVIDDPRGKWKRPLYDAYSINIWP